MVGTALTGAALAGFAWAARGRSSQVFAPSVWRGPRDRRTIALTFDDGPTPGTARLLELLRQHGVRATFFECGAQVRRYPQIAGEVASAGHEIGNHTDTHPRLWLRSTAFLRDEIGEAQDTISKVTGRSPKWFRAPYGVRWPGLGAVQNEFGLTGAMWTTIGRDWMLDSAAISRRMIAGAAPGAIFCLHDGRELAPAPDIRNTLDAVAAFLPVLIGEGWRFVTVSELVGYSGPVCPTTSYGV